MFIVEGSSVLVLKTDLSQMYLLAQIRKQSLQQQQLTRLWKFFQVLSIDHEKCMNQLADMSVSVQNSPCCVFFAFTYWSIRLCYWYSKVSFFLAVEHNMKLRAQTMCTRKECSFCPAYKLYRNIQNFDSQVKIALQFSIWFHNYFSQPYLISIGSFISWISCRKLC